MRVAVDAQQTVGTSTGIGAYCRGLLEALTEGGIDVVALRDPHVDPWRFDRRVIWDQGLLPLRAMRSGASLLHCTSGSVPLVRTLPTVVTVHDVAWLRGVQAHAPAYARWYFGAFSGARWQGAGAVIVDSAFTRGELLASTSVSPAKVTVVHPGVDASFSALVRRPSAEVTLLCVGTVERRKNASIAIEALASIPQARLLCAGPATPYQDECAELARKLGVDDRVTFLGYVEPGRLAELYATATIALAPSRYEGFGYAAAQALCAGIPLLAARASSHIEVVGDDATLLDPGDATAWTRAIAALLEDRQRSEAIAHARRARASQRFSWTAAAAATSGVYREVLEGPRRDDGL